MTTWRLIETAPAPGAWNMALDEAILEAIGHGLVPPTLRLFAWKPPCLSLGYAQPVSDVDRQALATRGWELVRRATGGRAILHTDELTYSVIGPADDPLLAGGVLESYRRIAEALLAALQRLQILAESIPNHKSPSGTEKNKEPVCFEVPSNYEITFYGKKLIGSAQARKQAGVLQHGTLPLCGDLTRITQVLRFPDEASRAFAARRLLERAITVESALGRVVTREQAAMAFREAFQERHDIQFETATPTETELARAEELVNEKYAHSSWTGRI
jgi:lipoate-protein ligase A